jgi:HEAT repeat protein
MSAQSLIEQIVELDKKTASLREQFESEPVEEREKILTSLFKEHLAELGDRDPVSVDLVRVTEMLCHVPSDSVPETLTSGLGHKNPEARLLTGDALLHIAADEIDRIMPAVETILDDGGIAAEELPFLLTDVDDPAVCDVICRFLDSPNAEIARSAIEALVDLGDPDAASRLELLVDDARGISGDDSEETLTIGQLAREAMGILAEED